VKRDRFERWLKNIYETRDEEISCTECFDLVSCFVDLEVSGKNAADHMPQVIEHLSQCRACREEYEVLRDLRRLEEEGKVPSRDDLEGSIK
jgi:predicted anti-sigma-YlaC factor YlaD